MKRAAVPRRLSPATRAYIQKTDAFRAGRDPVRLMRAAPARLERAVRGLSRAQLRKRPAPGKWSIEEILGHLVDTEIVYGYRGRSMIAESGRPIPGYDQDRWAAAFRGRRPGAAAMLRQIRLLRAINLDQITGVPRGWWSRYGRHAERGNESVRRMLELLAGHDLNHLSQINAIRKTFGWMPRRRARRGRRPRARARAAA